MTVCARGKWKVVLRRIRPAGALFRFFSCLILLCVIVVFRVVVHFIFCHRVFLVPLSLAPYETRACCKRVYFMVSYQFWH